MTSPLTTDLILRNGNIVTMDGAAMDGAGSVAQALAVVGGKVKFRRAAA